MSDRPYDHAADDPSRAARRGPAPARRRPGPAPREGDYDPGHDPYADDLDGGGRAPTGYGDPGHADPRHHDDLGYGHRRYDDGAYDDDPYDDGAYDDDDGYEEDYVTVRRSGGRGGRRLLTVLGGSLLVLLVALAGAGFWVSRQIDPPGEPGEVVQIEIPEGSTSDDIGTLLADEGIITSSFVWEWYIRVNGGGPFQAGLYDLRLDSSMGEVVDVLEGGPKPPEERSVTVPEGLTATETVARLADPEKGLGLDAAVLQQLLTSGEVRSRYLPEGQTNPEGTLFPETYRVGEDFDERSVLTTMIGQLDATLAELGVESAQERFNLTPYEVLIVASLIEEETKVDAERPQVARVIYNRLRTGTPLGIDATSRYEAELEGRDRSDIDFTSDSPYNTRRVAGLPPTPIANPGRASIEAALNPAEGDWLYYVLADEQGNHFFTASYDEFLAAKERCADAGLGCG